MSRARALLGEHWGDALVVLLCLVGVAQALWFTPWETTDDGVKVSQADPLVAALFAPLWSLPLLYRRRNALLAGVAVPAAVAVEGFVSPEATTSSAVFVAILASSAVVGLYETRRRAAVGGIAIFALIVTLIATTEDATLEAGDVFVSAIFALGPLAAGQVVRDIGRRNAVLEELAHELEREQVEVEREAVAEERARIANELHDVIAHGVSVMTVQASGARLLLRTDPERARTAILAVEDAGRDALAETRRLLGILRRDASVELAPQPGIADLEALFARARDGGLEMAFRVEGEPRPVTPTVGLAAYRVVADACEFAREAGGVRRGEVVVRWLPDAIEIEIEVAGDGSAGRVASAKLLARVEERIHLSGGTLETRLRDDGAGVFKARIPLEVSP